MIAKIICVIFMTYCHMKFGRIRKEFENDQIAKSDKYYRYWNEANVDYDSYSNISRSRAILKSFRRKFDNIHVYIVT